MPVSPGVFPDLRLRDPVIATVTHFLFVFLFLGFLWLYLSVVKFRHHGVNLTSDVSVNRPLPPARFRHSRI